MVVLFAFLLGSAAVAPPDTVYALPEMTVMATRFEAGTAELGQRVQRIDALDIERSASRTVADALSRNAAVHVRRYGASGLASLSIRGTGASQTSILLDGRRIADPQLGQLDLSLLPVDMLSSIELLHGAASAMHGADGIGGAVNLRTRVSRDGLHGAASIGMGDFGERAVSGWISAGEGAFGLLVTGRRESIENDYPYYSRALGQEVRVQGADREQSSLFASGRYVAARGTARVSGMITSSERGLPAGSGLESRERQNDDALRIWTDLAHQIPRGEIRLGGLIQVASLRYRNTLLGLDDTGETTLASADMEVRKEFGPWRFLSGVELGRTSAAHPSIADDRTEYRQSVFAQADGPIGAVRFFPALRIDRYDVQDEARTAVSPSIATNAALWPAAPIRVRASVGQSFRMPTFNDRFWTPGGNPELRPEQGHSSDAGLIFESERLSADVGVFLMNVHDQIVWRPTSDGFWSPRNLTRTRAVGTEASGSLIAQVAGLPFGLNMSYRLTDVRDRSDPDAVTYNQLLRYRPRHTFSALASTIIRRVDISMSLTGAGRVYTTDDQSGWLDPHAVVAARVARPFAVRSSTIRLTAEVDNLFGNQYALVENRPMPPRHFRIGLQLSTSSQQ